MLNAVARIEKTFKHTLYKQTKNNQTNKQKHTTE